jgi:8-oxo-dGTP pyrophosphatase MutT (NUDIX family)
MRRPRYLVVQHESGGHWGFPKGHPDAGETEMETAKREIAEETGLHVDFRDGFFERLYYLTPKERRKEVVFFLSRVRRPRVRPEHGEIRGYRWLPYWETRELLTYENTKLVLDKAHEFLTERGL